MKYTTPSILAVLMIAISANVFAGKIISKSESESILRDTIANTPGCIVIDELANLPISLEERPRKRSDKYKVKAMDAMAAAGLLDMKKEKVVVKGKTQVAFGFNQKFTKKVRVHTYSISDVGKEFYRDNAVQVTKRTRSEPKKGPGFCYADKLEVTGIHNYVGPTVLNYYINAVDAAEWASNKKLIDAGLIVGKTRGKPFLIKGQAAPPAGEKVQARFMETESGNGDWILERY